VSAKPNLYDCPLCTRDPWNCTCLSKERVRRIAYVIGYPRAAKAAAEATTEFVPGWKSPRDS
jgi:hypothetical protein